MQREYFKRTGAWILSWAFIALSVNVTWPGSWILIFGACMIPPIVLWQMWPQPAVVSKGIRLVPE